MSYAKLKRDFYTWQKKWLIENRRANIMLAGTFGAIIGMVAMSAANVGGSSIYQDRIAELEEEQIEELANMEEKLANMEWWKSSVMKECDAGVKTSCAEYEVLDKIVQGMEAEWRAEVRMMLGSD